MADIALPSPQRIDFPRRALELIPGIALLAAIGYAGKLIEQSISAYSKAHALHLPNIEYVLWAILIGLVIANTVGVPRIFKPGVATYEFWLKAGIVFLGVRFLIGDVLRLGGVSLVLVAVELSVSIALMTVLGRWFRLKPKLISLLAIGSSICGVSAIIAAKGAIEAEDDDASYAIAAILALGAIALFFFPLIGHALGMSDHAFGLWAGLGVDNTAEATATGALYSDTAAKYAVLAKTTRNATIGFVVLGYAIYWASRGSAQQIDKQGAIPLAEIPQIHPGISVLIAHRLTRRLQQGAGGEPRQSLALGLPPHLRRRRPHDRLPRDAEARHPPLHRRRRGRSGDRSADARPRRRRRRGVHDLTRHRRRRQRICREPPSACVAPSVSLSLPSRCWSMCAIVGTASVGRACHGPATRIFRGKPSA
jgi:uncharacterized integral membrane protein (TIGR00698 family)